MKKLIKKTLSIVVTATMLTIPCETFADNEGVKPANSSGESMRGQVPETTDKIKS